MHVQDMNLNVNQRLPAVLSRLFDFAPRQVKLEFEAQGRTAIWPMENLDHVISSSPAERKQHIACACAEGRRLEVQRL